MNALVTGGAGFIGSNLVDALLRKSFEVSVFDDFSTGRKENLSGKNVRIVNGDVRDYQRLKKAAKGCDVVFHMAAQVGNVLSIQEPKENIEINSIGTLNILGACRELGIGRMVYSSSCAIFGETRHSPIDEEHPLQPVSPYGVGKLCGEQLCLTLGPVYGVKTACLRYFNVYGRNQRFNPYGNVLPIFAERINRGEALTVYGDGKQTRDFVDVRDVVAANILAFEKEASGAFNIATGVATSVNKLVQLSLRASGSEVEVIHAQARVGEVRDSVASIAKAKKILGYLPKIGLGQGVADYFEWFNGVR